MEEELTQTPTLISWEAWQLRRIPSSAPPDLAVKAVVEKPFTNASGQPVPVHGTCSLQRGSKKIPVVMTGGVFKIARDFHGQPTEGLTA